MVFFPIAVSDHQYKEQSDHQASKRSFWDVHHLHWLVAGKKSLIYKVRLTYKAYFLKIVTLRLPIEVPLYCVSKLTSSAPALLLSSALLILEQELLWCLTCSPKKNAAMRTMRLSEPELVIAESKLVRSCFQSKYKSHLQMFFVDGGRWRGWIRYGKPHKLEYFWRKMMLHLIFLISNTSKTLVYLLLQQSLPWDWINFDILVHLLFLCTGSCHLMKVFWWNLRLKEQKS